MSKALFFVFLMTNKRHNSHKERDEKTNGKNDLGRVPHKNIVGMDFLTET
jgi:hypothetical protein